MHPHLPQGIRVEEGTNQQQAIQGVEIRPTAFIGACQRGPLDTPILVRSAVEFSRIFGAVCEQYPLPQALRLFFLNGGRQALVVRVAHNAKASYIELPGELAPLRLWSRFPGSHDYLRAAVDYDGIDQMDVDCFNLTVQRIAQPDTEHVVDQEIYQNISSSDDHPNFLPHALAGSHLVRVDEKIPPERPLITLNHSTGRPQYFQGLSDNGHAGTRITMADVLGASASRTGLFALTEQYDFGQLYIPPLDFDTDVSVPVLRTAARMCDRRHAVLVADAPRTWSSVDEAVEGVQRFSLRGPNVALYYPWLNSSDTDKTATGRDRVPPGGAVAGALERTAVEDGPSATPAGHRVVLRGFRKFADSVNEQASFKLSKCGINSLRYSKGGRKVIWDAVLLNAGTRSSDHNCDDLSSDAQKSLRVRRVVQYVSRSIEHGLKWVIFEDHSDHLWRRVEHQVNAFLEQSLRRGWLAGTTPDNAYRVRCDLSTNPGALRHRAELGLVLELAPLIPSRFVKLELVVPTAGNANYG